VTPRVVFDASTVVSALLFTTGRLAWLRQHWREGGCIPLISHTTAAELTRVLAYPKFRLTSDDRRELLGEYLPYCEAVDVTVQCEQVCRDVNNQPFLDLAQTGKADLLVSGDEDLLALTGQTEFLIDTPEAYRRRLLKT
jgi:putative PIN family toxin of toxin-antitoxin system